MCEIVINAYKHTVNITDIIKISIYPLHDNAKVVIIEMGEKNYDCKIIRKFVSPNAIVVVCYPDFTKYKELIEAGVRIVVVTNGNINFEDEIVYQDGYVYSTHSLEISSK